MKHAALLGIEYVVVRTLAGDNAEDAAKRISDRSHQRHLDDEESRQRRQHRTRIIQDKQGGEVGRDCLTGQPQRARGDRPATGP
jgi:hypothetical protein